MIIRTILISVDGNEAARPLMETAFLVARDFKAHVSGLHVCYDARDALPLLGEGMSGGMIEELIDMAEKEAAERAGAASRMFADFCEHRGIPMIAEPAIQDGATASWFEREGEEEEVIVSMAKLSDLTVIGRPRSDTDPAAQAKLNTVLFETGRPVLIAPPESPSHLGQHIAIAWNSSVEAARAVQAAIPFIEQAEQVTIITAESHRTATKVAEDLKTYMAWHGVEADIRTLAGSSKPVGEGLLNACDDIDADLLVMGGFTHSRMRQLILGGVTSHVIANATIPVLMVH